MKQIKKRTSIALLAGAFLGVPSVMASSYTTYDAVIDVAAIYSQGMINDGQYGGGGSEAVLRSKFINAIGLAHQAFSDSGTKIKINLVALKKANWIEGQGDAVAATEANLFADEVGADIAMVIRNGGSYWHGGNQTVFTGGPGDIVVGHEIGHVLGAGHGNKYQGHQNSYNSNGANGYIGMVVIDPPGKVRPYARRYSTLMTYPHAPNIDHTFNRFSMNSGYLPFNQRPAVVNWPNSTQRNAIVSSHYSVGTTDGYFGNANYNNVGVMMGNRFNLANKRHLKLSYIDGKRWLITSKHAKKFVSVQNNGHGQNVYISSNAAMAWKVRKSPQSDYCTLNLNTYFFDVDFDSYIGTTGAYAQTNALNGDGYYWKFDNRQNGFYSLRNLKYNTQYLDVEYMGDAEGTRLWIWLWNGSDAQLFELIPIID